MLAELGLEPRLMYMPWSATPIQCILRGNSHFFTAVCIYWHNFFLGQLLTVMKLWSFSLALTLFSYYSVIWYSFNICWIINYTKTLQPFYFVMIWGPGKAWLRISYLESLMGCCHLKAQWCGLPRWHSYMAVGDADCYLRAIPDCHVECLHVTSPGVRGPVSLDHLYGAWLFFPASFPGEPDWRFLAFSDQRLQIYTLSLCYTLLAECNH